MPQSTASTSSIGRAVRRPRPLPAPGAPPPSAPAIRQFEEQTGHKVSMEPTTNYAEKLVVEFVSGTAADVPHANNTVMPKLFDQGMILDMTSYVKRDKMNLQRDYGLMGQEFWDGKILTM